MKNVENRDHFSMHDGKPKRMVLGFPLFLLMGLNKKGDAAKRSLKQGALFFFGEDHVFFSPSWAFFVDSWFPASLLSASLHSLASACMLLGFFAILLFHCSASPLFSVFFASQPYPKMHHVHTP